MPDRSDRARAAARRPGHDRLLHGRDRRGHVARHSETTTLAPQHRQRDRFAVLGQQRRQRGVRLRANQQPHVGQPVRVLPIHRARHRLDGARNGDDGRGHGGRGDRPGIDEPVDVRRARLAVEDRRIHRRAHDLAQVGPQRRFHPGHAPQILDPEQIPRRQARRPQLIRRERRRRRVLGHAGILGGRRRAGRQDRKVLITRRDRRHRHAQECRRRAREDAAHNRALRHAVIRRAHAGRRVRAVFHLVREQRLPRHRHAAGPTQVQRRVQFGFRARHRHAVRGRVHVLPQLGALDQYPALGPFAIIGARLQRVGLRDGGRPPLGFLRAVFRRQRVHLGPLGVRRGVESRQLVERLPDLTQPELELLSVRHVCIPSFRSSFTNRSHGVRRGG